MALVLLAALGVAGVQGGLLRGEETEPMKGLEVELWWADDQATPVHRLMLSSADRAGVTRVWRDERSRVMLRDIPGLEDLLDQTAPGRRHIAILNAEECRTLYDALEKQQASDWKPHPGYDAIILYDGNVTRRNLGAPAETCKFLREISAQMQPQTAAAIAAFTEFAEADEGEPATAR